MVQNSDEMETKVDTGLNNKQLCSFNSKQHRKLCNLNVYFVLHEPPHDKTNKMTKGIYPVWSESSQCAQWIAEDPEFLHADSEVSDQTGWMPKLIWVFAGRTCHLLVLSWGGSHLFQHWECRLFFSLFQYVLTASYIWIFVEGLYLHMLIFVSVFTEKTRILWYMLFGWCKYETLFLLIISIYTHWENQDIVILGVCCQVNHKSRTK